MKNIEAENKGKRKYIWQISTNETFTVVLLIDKMALMQKLASERKRVSV